MEARHYIAIDLKSFYASVECVERGLDPMRTNLVVADSTRTEKTICLAVSPPLKAHGIHGRARLFEVVQTVGRINAERRRRAPEHEMHGSSCDDDELRADALLELDYIVAPPRMAHYMKCSTEIYKIYLKYAAAEDIHVYSIDEVFIDATRYLSARGQSARELAVEIISDVLRTTGITATAGIGTNLYLCKVALDIWAKHVPPDENGVRIAELDELSYRRNLWTHRPLTDFWRIGRGYAKKLEANGLMTMGDIARCSLGGAEDYHNEALLYRLFGVNAELLIDHAWGWEPCTIADVKAYRPDSSSIGAGQVLPCPYGFEKARLVAWEMAERLSLELAEKRLATRQLSLTVGYDIDNLKDPERREKYVGEVKADRYGRAVPKPSHGVERLELFTASTRLISAAVTRLFERIVNRQLLVRRLYLTAEGVVDACSAPEQPDEEGEQLDLFTDYDMRRAEREAQREMLERERRLQQAILGVKNKFGKNAILKGTNFVEGATARERNEKIGGHKA